MVTAQHFLIWINQWYGILLIRHCATRLSIKNYSYSSSIWVRTNLAGERTSWIGCELCISTFSVLKVRTVLRTCWWMSLIEYTDTALSGAFPSGYFFGVKFFLCFIIKTLPPPNPVSQNHWGGVRSGELCGDAAGPAAEVPWEGWGQGGRQGRKHLHQGLFPTGAAATGPSPGSGP